ncbi:TetR family transcriptional regulator [Agrobacterium tumefaciens]|nr:TetR family transcriptional regulator [Agrobacterium tumefaciens]
MSLQLLIKEAAITRFAQNGFHQTTTAQICAAVGRRSGNLFYISIARKRSSR